MSLESTIPVRFKDGTAERLKSASDRSGLPVSTLIRIATEQYLKEIERSGSLVIGLREEPPPYRTTKKP